MRKPYKPYIAQSSELHDPRLNPKGIWSAKYLVLMSALNRGDNPENVKQALFDWLGEKGVGETQVMALLNQEPNAALDEIIKFFRAGLEPQHLPAQVTDTLLRTLSYIARGHRQRRGHDIAKEISGLRQMKRRYASEALVRHLISYT